MFGLYVAGTNHDLKQDLKFTISFTDNFIIDIDRDDSHESKQSIQLFKYSEKILKLLFDDIIEIFIVSLNSNKNFDLILEFVDFI